MNNNNDDHEYDCREAKESEDSSESLLDHGNNLNQFSRIRHQRSRSLWPIALHATAILLYGLAAASFTYYSKVRKGQPLIYSPANKIVEYRSQQYDANLLGDPDYFGEPSERIDANWHKLLAPASVYFTESERQHFDAESPIVQFPDGRYLGQVWVYHELHCLKRLYQYINLDHYFPNMTERERELNKKHTEHCLGTIRQGIMCHGDVSLMSMVWGKRTRMPIGDLTNPHQCVNFEKLHEWALERAVTDGTEPGVLVHPTLGPSFPDGIGAKIGFDDADVDEDGNIITDDSSALV